jgi:hypothetical protein
MVQHTWKTLKTRFQPLVKNIERHRAILEKHVDLNTYEKLHQEGAKVLVELKKLQENEESRKRIEVLRSLQAANVEDDQVNLALERDESLNSGRWFIDSDQFKVWSDLDLRDPIRKAVLWVAGIPGAGNFQVLYVLSVAAN